MRFVWCFGLVELGWAGWLGGWCVGDGLVCLTRFGCAVLARILWFEVFTLDICIYMLFCPCFLALPLDHPANLPGWSCWHRFCNVEACGSGSEAANRRINQLGSFQSMSVMILVLFRMSLLLEVLMLFFLFPTFLYVFVLQRVAPR